MHHSLRRLSTGPQASLSRSSGRCNAGEGSFTLQSVSLAAYTGTTLNLRFNYSFSTGVYYPDTSTGVGWVFDNIQVGDTFTTREWSIGAPTAAEQHVIELVNRARADSQAELSLLVNTTDSNVTYAYEYFSVDLDILTEQFSGTNFGPGAISTGDTNAIPSILPPLAPNTKLTTAARLHTEDMFNNQFQGHSSSSGASSPNQPGDQVGTRVNRQGYTYQNVAENVSSYSESAWDSHAAFIVDWGTSGSTGLTYAGMQDPAGHRNNIYMDNIREIGAGVTENTNGTVGPFLVTHALATESNYDQPFITGVAYYDLDADGFYDEGEGIGGITIKVEDSVYHATTPDSGGYAIPVNSNGAYTLTYTMPDGSTGTKSVTVSNLENVKADITPAWSSTTINGTSTYETDDTVTYRVDPVAAATAYKLYLWEVSSWPGNLGAEDSSNVTLTTTGTYSARDDNVAKTGSYSYRLLSNDGNDQVLQLNYDILVGSSSTLSWQDRAGIVHANQGMYVQVSTDSGTNWTSVETRNGPGTSGYTTTFSERTISLDAYADQVIRVRFLIYNPSSSSFYIGSSENNGWYMDDISFTGAEILINEVSSEGTNYEWDFSSPDAAIFLLRAQVINNTNSYPIGQGFRIQAFKSNTITREDFLVASSGTTWYTSSWMGYYYAPDDNWIYHYTLGWLYYGGTSGVGAWFYSPETNGSGTALGWVWSRSDTYPALYQYSGSKWIYYHEGSTDPLYFYDQTAETWLEY